MQMVISVDGSDDAPKRALTFWFRRFNLQEMTEWLTFSTFLCWNRCTDPAV